MTTDKLGARLRLARESREITQATAARFLGVRTMTLSSYENGKSVPRVDFLNDAATLYAVDVAWLASGAGDGPREAA